MLFEQYQLNLFFYIVYIVFIVNTAIQLIYYWYVFSKFAFYHKKQKLSNKKPVSVVICAKNEYKNLKKNLPFVLEQDYPDFEVIVVNDASEDDSIFLLKSFSKKYSNLKIVNIQQDLNFFKGKKFPLSIGIKSAKNDIIILTDADCKPASNKWIDKISSNFTDKTEIVLGYGKYESRKGLINKIIRFDTLHIAIQYFSFSLIGQTYMGVGRNLAYRKSLFYKNKGFILHYTISSGDDDLFINNVATKNNSRIEISPESHTISIPKTSFLAWMKQKRRHLSTGRYYKFRHKLLLGVYSITQFLFYLTFIILICLHVNVLIVLLIFALRLLSQLIIFKLCMIKLGEKKILLYSPLFELFFVIINPILAFLNLIIKQNKWR